MAGILGERVKIIDNPTTGEYHWEYRTTADRVRLDKEAKVRNAAIANEVKISQQRLKQERARANAQIAEAYKNKKISASQANKMADELKTKYRGI